MKTYSLITKPVRIRLKPNRAHTLTHAVLPGRHIGYGNLQEFWCAKGYSPDHKGGKSLILFNHSFISTFKLDSDSVISRWDIIESDMDWESDIQVLAHSYVEQMEIMWNGQVIDNED